MALFAVYNGFWNSEPPETVRMLERAAQRLGETLTPVANTAWSVCVDKAPRVAGVKPGDTVLFFDKDVRLAKALEQMGVRVFNSADAIAVCDDKAATHLALATAGFPQPRTWIAPMAYAAIDTRIAPFLDCAEDDLGYPMVVKECYGSLGNQVYLARDRAELKCLALSMKERAFLLQEYIETGRQDKRLYVVGDRVVAAMRRHSNCDFRANIGQGGHGETYLPTEQETDLALACCKHLGLWFGGVDLLNDQNGNTVICEVNSNAQTVAISRVTGVDVAGEIVKAVL